jgi:hypothetical protein
MHHFVLHRIRETHWKYILDLSCGAEVTGRRQESEIEVTPAMIEAGADALLDGSKPTQVLSPNDAAFYAERVLRAAPSSRQPLARK